AFCQNYVVDYNLDKEYTLVRKAVTADPASPYQKAQDKIYGVINSANKIVVPIQYKSIMLSGEPGVFIVKNQADNAGLFSAITQKIIVEPEYFDIEIFREGLAVVKMRKPDFDFAWGAVNVHGKMVIPFEYDYLGPVSEGLMNFEKDKKKGFLDKTNKVIIPPMYGDYSTFNEGLAAVKTLPDGKYGYIDKNNNMVIAAQYEDANPFYDGYAVVAKKKGYSMGGSGKQTVTVPGEFVLIDRSGKEIIQNTYNRISPHQAGGLFIIELKDKKGVMDSTGKTILPVEYADAIVDKNGYIIYRTADKKFGLMSSGGAEVLSAKYDYVSATSNTRYYSILNGRYEVADVKKNIVIKADSANGVVLGKKRIVYYYTNKVKIFDANGNLQKTIADLNLKRYGHTFTETEDSIKLNSDATTQLINLGTATKKILPFSEAGDFNEEGIFVGKSLGYDFYDHTGKKLNTGQYFSVVNFSEGICALQVGSKGTPHLADKNFTKIKDLYTYYKGPYSEGLAYAVNEQGTIVYYLNRLGYEAFNINAKEGGKCTEGFITIKGNDGRYYHVNKKGKAISPKTWEAAGNFSEGLAMVKDNGKWGFIDTLGNKVIDLKFDVASNFTKGAAMVKSNNQFYLVNKKGVAIDNNKYEAAGNPGNGSFPVQKNGLAGLVDNKGNTIIDFKYNSILYMTEDRVWAAKDGKWGLLDNKGKALTDFIYQAAYDFDDGFARIISNDKVGLVNKAGKLVLPAEYKSLGSVYKNSILGIKPDGPIIVSIK
ncbi:MAG TPA: WG repeat-containing protein, partial [Ferruginibacter sp.]|nr:WG repeat-containing protein [Ferruginibacter sp.]